MNSSPSSLVFAPSVLTDPRVVLPTNFAIGVTGALFAVSRSNPIHVLVALAFGALLWTLTEYAVHRWLMHQTRTPLLRKLWIATHRDHHRMRDMDDPTHRSLSLAVSAPILGGAMLITALAFTSFLPVAIAAGFALGFCWYETLHFAEHDPRISRRVTLPWFAHRQRLHASHHFDRMSSNFGFTTSLWDRAFRTYAAP